MTFCQNFEILQFFNAFYYILEILQKYAFLLLDFSVFQILLKFALDISIGGLIFRFVFITITPRPAAYGDKHKILILNISGIWLGLQKSKIKVRQFQEVVLP